MEAVISERCDEKGYWVISIKMAKADFMRLFPGELETESSIPL